MRPISGRPPLGAARSVRTSAVTGAGLAGGALAGRAQIRRRGDASARFGVVWVVTSAGLVDAPCQVADPRRPRPLQFELGRGTSTDELADDAAACPGPDEHVRPNAER